MTRALSDRIVRARKPRTCDQCLTCIQPGQRYRRVNFPTQRHRLCMYGEVHCYAAHEDCDEAVKKYGNLEIWTDGSFVPALFDELTPADFYWLFERFPAVADRFGIQGALTRPG